MDTPKLSQAQAFNESLSNGTIVVLKDEVYLHGTHGDFKIGCLMGDNKVELEAKEEPYNTKTCSVILRDLLRLNGYQPQFKHLA